VRLWCTGQGQPDDQPRENHLPAAIIFLASSPRVAASATTGTSTADSGDNPGTFGAAPLGNLGG